MQLIVIGMHRSGTSVLARLLNLMGTYFAPEGVGTGANQENPKGFWERRDVRALNDFVLHGVGCDWNRVSRFDAAAIPAPLLAEFDKRASQIVLSMDANRPWFMKEPRLCLLLPLWRRVLEAPICVHILRHPVEVASSLRTRNKIPIEAGLALWEAYNRSAVDGMQGLSRIVVRHRELMQVPVVVAAALHAQLEALGVRRLILPTAAEIASFVADELYREREGECGLDAFANAPQLKLFKRWSTGKDLLKGDQGLDERERKTLVAYEASLPPFTPPSPSAPKKSVEADLREKIAVTERQAHALKEQLQYAQGLLSQREQQAVFIETEFTALRASIAARDATSGDLVASLQKMLWARDAWIQERDRGAEIERTRVAEEIARLAGKLDAATAASTESERRLEEELRRAALRDKELLDRNELIETLSEKLKTVEQACADTRNRCAEEIARLAEKLDAVTAASTESERRLEEELRRAALRDKELLDRNELIETLSEKLKAMEQACADKDAELGVLSELLKNEREGREKSADDCELLRHKVEDRFAEIEILTKLLIEQERASHKLTLELSELKDRLEGDRKARFVEAAKAKEMHESMRAEATSHVARIRDLEHAREKQSAVLVEALNRSQALEVALAHAMESLQGDKASLQAILGSSSWRATAPLRRLKGVLDGRPRELPIIFGADVALVRESGLFDAGWYLDRYGDVASSGIDPLEHYLAYGAGEGRDPGPGFSTSRYLEMNPDVAAARINPLVHYLSYGKEEGRICHKPDKEREAG